MTPESKGGAPKRTTRKKTSTARTPTTRKKTAKAESAEVAAGPAAESAAPTKKKAATTRKKKVAKASKRPPKAAAEVVEAVQAPAAPPTFADPEPVVDHDAIGPAEIEHREEARDVDDRAHHGPTERAGEGSGEGEQAHQGERRRRRRRRRRGGGGGGGGNGQPQNGEAREQADGRADDHRAREPRPGDRRPDERREGDRPRDDQRRDDRRRDDRGGGGQGRSGHDRPGRGNHPGDDRRRNDRPRDEARPPRRPEPELAGDEGGPDPDNLPRPQRMPAPEKGQIERWEEIFESKTFADLGLRNSVLKGIEKAGFKNPTKIQSQLIPMMLAGKDVLGQSRTGTGKTAAFGLPLFNNASRDLPFQSIIMAPTRELAIQIAAELTELGQFTPIKVCAVYGGSSMDKQRRQLQRNPEIIVATPGRLYDVFNRGMLHFRNVKFVVLDEVDRMLDIGFREDIKKILSQIRTTHQTVFVSATISEEIEKLSRTFMHEPDKIVTTGTSLTVSMVEQHYISVNEWDKRRMLHHILTHSEPDLTIVFCNMKRTVDAVARSLEKRGIEVHAIHGDMPQGKRNAIMTRLRAGHLSVLIASDLAARGLDVEGISHVVNFDLPDDPEIYIHRVGRTARAGRHGVAWALVSPEDGPKLTQIEKLANVHIPELKYEDFVPGPPPEHVQQRREADVKRLESAKSKNRFQATAKPAGPATMAVEAVREKFPDGIVPSKMPPKKLGGRVRTSRSMKAEKPATQE